MATKHSMIGKNKSSLERLCKAFVLHRMLPACKRVASDIGDIDWKDPKQLLEIRKKLGAHVKAAFEDRDDRFANYIEKGQTNNAGHEPEMAVLCAMIDYHIGEALKRALSF